MTIFDFGADLVGDFNSREIRIIVVHREGKNKGASNLEDWVGLLNFNLSVIQTLTFFLQMTHIEKIQRQVEDNLETHLETMSFLILSFASNSHIDVETIRDYVAEEKEVEEFKRQENQDEKPN